MVEFSVTCFNGETSLSIVNLSKLTGDATETWFQFLASSRGVLFQFNYLTYHVYTLHTSTTKKVAALFWKIFLPANKIVWNHNPDEKCLNVHRHGNMKFYTSSDFKRHVTGAASTTIIITSNYNNELNWVTYPFI